MEKPKAVENSLHKCPVVGCHSRFSSKGSLSSHLGNGCCSPHHPLRHFLDLKLPAAVGFACPACNPPYCNRVFSSVYQHLKTCGNDNKLIHPVAIGGYGCPQCLAIYPTQVLATEHIQDNNHHQIYPQFTGNMTPSSQALLMPLAVIKHLKKTYEVVPWHLKCMTCQINLGPYNNELDGLFNNPTRLKVKPHVKNGHSLHLDACTAMTEALRILLSKPYTCTQCLCLLEVCPPSQIHQCSHSVTGEVVSVNGINLQDFLLRCALTSIKPVKVESNLSFWKLHWFAGNASGLQFTALAQPVPVENNCNNSNSSGFQLEKNNVIKRIGELKVLNNGTAAEMCRDEENLSDVPLKEGSSNHRRSQTVPDSSTPVQVMSLISDSDESSDSDCMEIPVLDDVLRSDFAVEVSSDGADNIGENVTLAEPWMKWKKETQKTPANSGPSGISHVVPGLSRKRTASGEDCEKTPQTKKPRLSTESQRLENSRSTTHPDFIPFSSSTSPKPSCSIAQSTTACPSQPNIFNRVVTSVRKCVDRLCLRNGSFPQNVGSRTTPAALNSQFHQYSVRASQFSTCANFGHSKNGQGVGLSSYKAGGNSTALTPGTTAKTKRPWARGKQRYFSSQNSAGSLTSQPNPPAQQTLVLPSANRPKQSDVNKANSNADSGDKEPQNLDSMNHIIFVDLDNWNKFFNVLPLNLPEKTFVWGFWGGKNMWTEPVNDPVYVDAKNRGLIHIHKRCGTTKNAADFAICFMVGRTDALVPKHIPFSILSGDRSFEELERQYQGNPRRVVVISPHFRDKYELYVLLRSVADT